MPSNIQKTFAPNSKDIRYTNRDFQQLRESLINFTKTYYPNTYKDFSTASPGMMFIEQAAYVGDVLSYYTDYAFKEGILESCTERRNIINLAKYLGYKVKPTKASSGMIDIYQLCPATDDGMGNYFPDPTYMLIIKENSQFSNNTNSYYILNELVDFNINTSYSPRTDTVYSRNSDGSPLFFLLKKSARISNGKVVIKEQVISSPQEFYKIYLDETNVIGILDVTDSDNNKWYEVDYIAQELVPIAIPNTSDYVGSLSEYKDSVPYILNYLKTSRRFTVNVDENDFTYLEFGSGIYGTDDEIVTFDSNLIGQGLSNISKLNVPLDPSNFLQNGTYGISPSNTTLKIRYLVGGGIESNCQVDDIRNVVSIEFDNPSEGLYPEQAELLNTVKRSVSVTNSEPCVGGSGSESNEDIKMNAMAYFATQNRTVTQDDYLVRIYAMPPKFGKIAKAQVISNSNLNVDINRMLSGTIDTSNVAVANNNSTENYFRKIKYDSTNPFSINIYVLSYDGNKKLTTVNDALINNLLTYLKQTKLLTDGINIIDGYIINIGVNFNIIVYKGFNKKDVLLNCINVVKDWFDIDKWGFSQPININQLQLEIAKVEGVQSVSNIKIVNKTALDGEYSPIEYNIESATKDGIVYPSVDPSCWEVKYPDSDIVASVL